MMHNTEILEITFVIILVIVFVCILWVHRDTIGKFFKQILSNNKSMFSHGGESNKDKFLDSQLPIRINIKQITNPEDPLFEVQPASFQTVINSLIDYNDEKITFKQYLEIINSDIEKLSPFALFKWATSLMKPQSNSPVETGIIYTMIINYYDKLIEIAPPIIKQDLEKNRNDIVELFSSDNYEFVELLSKSLIDSIADVTNEITYSDRDEYIDLSEQDENDILKNILVEKKTFKPQSESKGFFGVHKKVAVSGGAYMVYTDDYVQKLYGPDVHIARNLKLRLSEFLDWVLPIKIYLTREPEIGLLSHISRFSSEFLNAVEDRERAFKFIMENTSILHKGKHVPFLQFILNCNSISYINSMSVYEWALNAFNAIANLSKFESNEFIYTSYLCILRYYKAFINIVSNKLTTITKHDTHKENVDTIRQYNAHVSIILVNLDVGYKLIKEKFGNNMEKLSISYINSIIRIFDNGTKHSFPNLIKKVNEDKLRKQIFDKLQINASNVGKISKIIKKLNFGTHHKQTHFDPTETKLYEENSLKYTPIDKINLDDTNTEEITVIKFSERKQLEHQRLKQRLLNTSNKVYTSNI